MTFGEVMRSQIFWLIMSMENTSLSLSFFLKTAFKDFGSTKFNDDKYLTMLAGMGFFTAAISRFIFGTLHDRFGFKKLFIGIIIIQILISFTLNASD